MSEVRNPSSDPFKLFPVGDDSRMKGTLKVYKDARYGNMARRKQRIEPGAVKIWLWLY